MTESVNEVRLSGLLGRDAEMAYGRSGTARTQLNLAVTEHVPIAGEGGSRRFEERTHWIRVTAWAELAEQLGPRLRKGDQVLIEGRLQTRSWDADDGTKRYAMDVVARRVEHDGEWLTGRRAGSRQGGGSSGGAAPARGPERPSSAARWETGAAASGDPDDLPFE